MSNYKDLPLDTKSGVLVSQGWGSHWLSRKDQKAAIRRAVTLSFVLADPRAVTDGSFFQCGSCRYMLALDGNYGICANKDSAQDGRLVFEHGGCDQSEGNRSEQRDAEAHK